MTDIAAIAQTIHDEALLAHWASDDFNKQLHTQRMQDAIARLKEIQP